MTGYFAIGVYQPKTIENIGTLWRSAYNFGAQYIFTIGRRYKKQASDTTKTWMKIPLFEYKTWEEFESSRPLNCVIVGIEQSDRSRDLDGYGHLPRSIYVLGSEDNGLPPVLQDRCNSVVHISTPMCLNMAVAKYGKVTYIRALHRILYLNWNPIKAIITPRNEKSLNHVYL